MSSVLKPQYITHEEYFALEQNEGRRYEYIAGEIFAMAGGSESHALIAMNILAALLNALGGRPYRVYGSDMKLHIKECDKFCYPDVLVLFEQGLHHGDYLENPVILVEILESSGRIKKLQHYRSIESLKYYLLFDQTHKHVQMYSKESKDKWILTFPELELSFSDLGISLEIDEIYLQVEFNDADKIPETDLVCGT